MSPTYSPTEAEEEDSLVEDQTTPFVLETTEDELLPHHRGFKTKVVVLTIAVIIASKPEDMTPLSLTQLRSVHFHN